MERINLADAKARFSELVDRAEAGESIEIIRRGRAVARLSAAVRTRKAVDVDRLRALTASTPPQAEDAATFVRSMRDGDRY